MIPSTNIREFIKGFEKCRLTAFKPTKNDKWTIGWGHTEGVTEGMVWTQAQANAVFDGDIEVYGSFVAAKLPGSPPTAQHEFDAMVSLCYNIGRANFAQSSVLTNHRAGHRSTVALAFVLWNKQRNKATGKLEVLAGLTRRRKAEAKIYLEGWA
jgi:lysozyme